MLDNADEIFRDANGDEEMSDFCRNEDKRCRYVSVSDVIQF
jgi:hypothetical protein